MKFHNQGTRDQPRIEVKVYFDRELSDEWVASFATEITYRCNLDLDLTPFYTQFNQDQVLGPILHRWHGMRPGHPSSLFEYLIIGIALQNATVRRSSQMFRVKLETYGQLLEYDGQQLWCFWEPGGLGQISQEALRALKVAYRAKSIKRIDDQFGRGEIDELELRQRGRETQRKALLKLYGVGLATAWYLLFDVFHLQPRPELTTPPQ